MIINQKVWTLKEIFQHVVEIPERSWLGTAQKATDYMLKRIEELNKKLESLGIRKKVVIDYLATNTTTFQSMNHEEQTYDVEEQKDTNGLYIAASDAPEAKALHQFTLDFTDVFETDDGLGWGDTLDTDDINGPIERALLATMTEAEKRIVWNIFEKQLKQETKTLLQNQAEAFEAELKKPSNE